MPAWRVASWLLVAALVTTCGEARPAGPAAVPDQPGGGNVRPPILTVATAVGPRGPYKAWIYRTNDGMVCFDVNTADTGMGSCGSDPTGILGASVGGDPQTGLTLTGGTTQRGAAGAVLTLSTGATQRYPLVRPGAFLPPDAQVYVILLPKGVGADQLDIVDGSGAVLETQHLLP